MLWVQSNKFIKCNVTNVLLVYKCPPPTYKQFGQSMGQDPQNRVNLYHVEGPVSSCIFLNLQYLMFMLQYVSKPL